MADCSGELIEGLHKCRIRFITVTDQIRTSTAQRPPGAEQDLHPPLQQPDGFNAVSALDPYVEPGEKDPFAGCSQSIRQVLASPSEHPDALKCIFSTGQRLLSDGLS